MPHLQAVSGERPSMATVGGASDKQGQRTARSLAFTANLGPRPGSCLPPSTPRLGRDLIKPWPCHPLLTLEKPMEKPLSGFHQLRAKQPGIPGSGHSTASELPLLPTTPVKSGPAKRRRLARARPNPSLNRSSNGRPPSPGWRYTVHFHQPGLGVLPPQPG